MSDTVGLYAGSWRGILSLAFGSIALFIFFVVRHWNWAALGEPADTIMSLVCTWLPVLLPVLGFGLGVIGIAKDRRRGAAVVATVVNVLGVVVAAMILTILAG